MYGPIRGLTSERSFRLFVPLIVLLFAACTSRGTIEIAEPSADRMPSPAGCTETVCDYFFDLCADPCEQCWDSCGREDDQLSVIKCTQKCSQLCSPDHKATPLTQCASDLEACRSTVRNTICVDRMRVDM